MSESKSVPEIKMSHKQALLLKSQLLADIESAQADMSVLEIELKTADMAAIEGIKGAEAEVSKLEAKIEALRSKIQKGQRRLAEVEEKYKEAIEADRQAFIEKQWQEIEQLANQRLSLGEDLAKLITDFAEKYRQFILVSEQMHLKAPKTPASLNESKLRGDESENSIRLALAAQGIRWAHRTQADDIKSSRVWPGFNQWLLNSNEWLFSAREKVHSEAST